MQAGRYFGGGFTKVSFAGSTLGLGETQFPIDPKTGTYSSTVMVKVSWEPVQVEKNVPQPLGPLVYRYLCVLRLRNKSGTWADLDGAATPPAWAQPVGDSTTVVSNGPGW
jgi:hypothetical protein